MLPMARVARPFARVLPRRLRTMIELAPTSIPHTKLLQRNAAVGARKLRVVLLGGCVQPAIAPQIDAATIRLLTRHGCEVVTGGGCCGALTHHLGKDAKDFARANIDRWMKEVEGEGLDAIVVNVSGCGVLVKDYGHLLKDDPDLCGEGCACGGAGERSVRGSGIALGLVPGVLKPIHKGCLSFGVFAAAWATGFANTENDFCAQPGSMSWACRKDICAAARPELTIFFNRISRSQLRDRKVMNIRSVAPQVVAAGNIGCLVQIANGLPGLPVVHTVDLLDWATGGPRPAGL